MPEILKMHMYVCNKSAVILTEHHAIHLYTILKSKTKQAYYGKDTITKFFTGYNYYGYFPTENLLKSRYYYFKAGIREWWKKYFKWCLMMITEYGMKEITARKSRTTDKNTLPESHSNNSSVYALCIIPFVGFMLSILFFILIDSYFSVNAFLFVKEMSSYLMKFCSHVQQSLRNTYYQIQNKVFQIIFKGTRFIKTIFPLTIKYKATLIRILLCTEVDHRLLHE